MKKRKKAVRRKGRRKRKRRRRRSKRKKKKKRGTRQRQTDSKLKICFFESWKRFSLFFVQMRVRSRSDGKSESGKI